MFNLRQEDAAIMATSATVMGISSYLYWDAVDKHDIKASMKYPKAYDAGFAVAIFFAASNMIIPVYVRGVRNLTMTAKLTDIGLTSITNLSFIGYTTYKLSTLEAN